METVHLAIDYQERYLSCLPPERATRFTAAARAFADDLKAVGVPTLWVAAGTAFLMNISPRAAARRLKSFIRKK